MSLKITDKFYHQLADGLDRICIRSKLSKYDSLSLINLIMFRVRDEIESFYSELLCMQQAQPKPWPNKFRILSKHDYVLIHEIECILPNTKHVTRLDNGWGYLINAETQFTIHKACRYPTLDSSNCFYYGTDIEVFVVNPESWESLNDLIVKDNAGKTAVDLKGKVTMNGHEIQPLSAAFDVEEFDQKSCDVTFRVNNEKIYHASRFMLCKEGEFFKRMLDWGADNSNNNNANNNNKIPKDISDISVQAFSLIMRYVHGQRVSLKECGCDILTELLLKAHMFELEHFMLAVQKVLVVTLQVEDVHNVLGVALEIHSEEKWDCRPLINCCAELLKGQQRKVLAASWMALKEIKDLEGIIRCFSQASKAGFTDFALLKDWAASVYADRMIK